MTNRPDDQIVRSFVVTDGRTEGPIDDLHLDTTVEVTGATGADLQFEPAALLQRCGRRITVSQLATALDLPIGTTKVLVGDLVTSGHLRIRKVGGHPTAESDYGQQTEMIDRLITGVKRLWQ